MKNSVICIVIFMASLVGCASTSELAQEGGYYEESGHYYKSIGQHDIAEEEYNKANDHYEEATSLFPVLVEIFGFLFTKSDQ